MYTLNAVPGWGMERTSESEMLNDQPAAIHRALSHGNRIGYEDASLPQKNSPFSADMVYDGKWVES